MTLRSTLSLLLGAIALGALFALAPLQSHADSSPFSPLLGSWGGTGELRLDQGRKERLKCNAYYTGGGAQLGVAIRCSSDSQKIEIRSKLTYSGGRLSGNWEERTYNATGSAAGTVTDGTIKLSIQGGVSGTMHVSFTKSRQDVSISTQGSAMQGVQISLART